MHYGGRRMATVFVKGTLNDTQIETGRVEREGDILYIAVPDKGFAVGVKLDEILAALGDEGHG